MQTKTQTNDSVPSVRRKAENMQYLSEHVIEASTTKYTALSAFQYLLCPHFAFITASILFLRLACFQAFRAICKTSKVQSYKTVARSASHNPGDKINLRHIASDP